LTIAEVNNQSLKTFAPSPPLNQNRRFYARHIMWPQLALSLDGYLELREFAARENLVGIENPVEL